MSSDSENLIALILINNICCSKQKQKNQKDQNVSNETMAETQERQKSMC